MHLYKAAADSIGTAEARELASRLESWHDAMVNHVRAIRVRGAECDDDCPHEVARALWAEALAVCGDYALRFTFLQSHGGALGRDAALIA